MNTSQTMQVDTSANIVFGMDLARLGQEAASIGTASIRYGVVLVIAWIGAMKFTAYEAGAIEGLVANSPLMGWVYGVTSVQGFSAALGIVELAIAAMIAVRALFPRLAAAGSVLAIGMFATTLSFMVTTPGVFEASLGGFPALSVVPGQFLVKDFVLLGASALLLGDALKAVHATED